MITVFEVFTSKCCTKPEYRPSLWVLCICWGQYFLYRPNYTFIIFI